MAKNQRDFFKKKNEWSEIKDTLLRCYLPQYFQKLLVSGKPIFYIDCFAGKGKFDDGNDGSPLIAMQIINERLGMWLRPFRVPRAVRFPPMLSATPSRTVPLKRGLSGLPDRLPPSVPRGRSRRFPARCLWETALPLRPAMNLPRRRRRSRRPRKVVAPHSAHQRHLLPVPRIPCARLVA